MARTIESPYLTAEEAAAYLRMSVKALDRQIREGRLPVAGRVGRGAKSRRRFDKRELDAWVRGEDSALDLVRKRRAG